MADDTPPPPPELPSVRPRNDWARATLWMVVIGIVALNAALVFRSCRNLPGEALDKTGKVVYTGLGGKQDLERAIRKAL